jgi:site-specific recombinase XerD
METMITSAMSVYLNALSPTSKKLYERNYKKFIEYKEEFSGNNIYSDTDVKDYIEFLHNCGLKASSLSSILSQLKVLYDISLNIDIKSMEKVIYRNLKLWAKQETKEKAKVIKKY